MEDDFYKSYNYVYEIVVFSNQTYDKISLGMLDRETYDSVIGELIEYLEDHKDFNCTVIHHRTNKHKDDYLEIADKFIRNTLRWDVET